MSSAQWFILSEESLSQHHKKHNGKTKKLFMYFSRCSLFDSNIGEQKLCHSLKGLISLFQHFNTFSLRTKRLLLL
jgi:hypothetical protein